MNNSPFKHAPCAVGSLQEGPGHSQLSAQRRPQHSQQPAWAPTKRQWWKRNQRLKLVTLLKMHWAREERPSQGLGSQVKAVGWHGGPGGRSRDPFTAVVCMGRKQWWSHARRELPGGAAVLIPYITWSSGQEPRLFLGFSLSTNWTCPVLSS